MSKITEARNAEKRFFAKILKTAVGCWLWLGKIDKDGFPRFMVSRRDWFVHRWAYSKFVGSLPDQSHIKQTCENKACVNPDHLQMLEAQSDQERFHSKYQMSNCGCLEWTDEPNSGGYGSLRVEGVKVLAHRYSYEMYHGPIPDGHEVHHKCLNRICVNPDHLETKTISDHRREHESGKATGAMNRAKTHCPQGHPYDAANTRIGMIGERRCRACGREAVRNNRKRIKTLPIVITRQDILRFWEMVVRDKLGCCWIWKGTIDRDGHGEFTIKSKKIATHKFVYRVFFGDLPKGKQIHLTCGNNRCVNPDHLRVPSRQATSER